MTQNEPPIVEPQQRTGKGNLNESSEFPPSLFPFQSLPFILLSDRIEISRHMEAQVATIPLLQEQIWKSKKRIQELEREKLEWEREKAMSRIKHACPCSRVDWAGLSASLDGLQ